MESKSEKMGKLKTSVDVLEKSGHPELGLLLIRILDEQEKSMTKTEIFEEAKRQYSEDGISKESIGELLKYLKGINWIDFTVYPTFNFNTKDSTYSLTKGGRRAYYRIKRVGHC